MWCARYERLISQALDMGRPLPRQVSRHMAACPNCRRFHADSLRIAEELTRTAPADLPTVSPSLKSDILRALAQSHPNLPLPSGSRQNWQLYLALATGAVAASLLLAFLHLCFPPQANQTPLASPARPPATVPSLASVSTLTTTAEHSLEPLGNAVATPLAEEWKHLADDTQAAAGFLISCLPGVPRNSTLF